MTLELLLGSTVSQDTWIGHTSLLLVFVNLDELAYTKPTDTFKHLCPTTMNI